jgi:hypothetical protein
MAFRSVARRVLFFVSLLVPVALAAQGQSGPPPEIREIFEQAKAACQAEGGRFVADPQGFYQTADFNGDNRPDYIVSPAGLHCSSFGYSEYCGSAGCVQTVLISEGNRLREVYSNNIQGFALVRLPNGRQGMATGQHGTFCGNQYGADTCFSVMSWNGRAWVSTRVQREPPELAAQIQSENAPPPPLPRWEGIPGVPATGPGALLQRHPQLPIILIRCVDGAPVVQVQLGAGANGNPLPVPPAGRPLTLRLGDDDEGGAGLQMIDLEAIQAPREFVGRLSPAAFALLAGQADMLNLEISSPEGDYWLPAESLSLAGSSAALRPVAALCGAGPRPAAAPASAAAPGQPVGPLGIVAGHYVEEGQPCSAPAFEVFYYDGTRIGLLREGERFIEPVGRVSRSGGAFVLEDWEMSVTRLSPTRIQREIQDTGPPERWCPADQIPAAQRYGG